MSQAIRILLVSHDATMRQHVRVAIERRDGGFVVTGEANDGMAALALLDAADPHVVVVSYRLPTMNGVETARHIRASRPRQRIVMLVDSVDAMLLAYAAAAGVTACLDKASLGELPDLLVSMR